jgi:hypothetical protein
VTVRGEDALEFSPAQPALTCCFEQLDAQLMEEYCTSHFGSDGTANSYLYVRNFRDNEGIRRGADRTGYGAF